VGVREGSRPAAADPVIEQRVMTLASELRCLVCQNQTLADSNAPLAEDLRNQVREKMRQGASDSEIVDYMVARYGDFVLYRPPLKLTTALLWFGPLLLLAGGFSSCSAACCSGDRRKTSKSRLPSTSAQQSSLPETRRSAGDCVRRPRRRARRRRVAFHRAAALAPRLAHGRNARCGQCRGIPRSAARARSRPARRNTGPDQHEKARGEIEARLLADVGKGDALAHPQRPTRAAALALGLAVPICALAVYVAVGNPRALLPQTAEGANAHGVSAQQFEAMVSRLAARLKENPEDAEGWMMLGRSYAVLERFGEASEAYAKAAARTPGDAQLLADYADALAMAQGRTLQGEPEKILLRALAVDPNNVKALLLAGTAAFNRNDGASAVRHWERVLGLLPAESDMVQRVQASIAQARSLGRSPGAKTQIAKPAQAPAAAG